MGTAAPRPQAVGGRAGAPEARAAVATGGEVAGDRRRAAHGLLGHGGGEGDGVEDEPRLGALPELAGQQPDEEALLGRRRAGQQVGGQGLAGGRRARPGGCLGSLQRSVDLGEGQGRDLRRGRCVPQRRPADPVRRCGSPRTAR